MRRLLMLSAVVLLATSCVSVVDTTTTQVTLPAATQTVPTTSSTTLPSSTTTTDSEGSIRQQVDELITQTEQVRELTFLEPPTVTIVDDQELADKVRQLISEDIDLDQVATDTALEELLGLVPDGTDLVALYEALYGEQVLGFYDGETKELVVPSTGGQLSELQKVTLVHELTHALTDQHYSFTDLTDRLDQDERYDALSALQAVAEGDATLTELHYVAGLSSDEKSAVIAGSLGQDTSVYDSAPRFIQDLLVYPYSAGLSLLETLWTPQEGFLNIDEAYLDPPATTEQVLHPEKYASREPAIPVELPETPVDGYETVEESTWGELLFDVTLSQVLGRTAADTAASGWGGDHYRILWNGSDVVLVLEYVGDSELDAEEMTTALNDFVVQGMGLAAGKDSEFGGDGYALITRNGDKVLFIAADTADAGRAARSAFPDF
jgi:hypothetical protein